MKIFKRIRRCLNEWRSSIPWILSSIRKRIPSRRLRMILLKMEGAKISPNVSIFASVDVRYPNGLVIGEGCAIGPKVLLDARKGLVIHKNVTIAYDAIIWTVHHDMNSIDFHTIGGGVEIEDYAWICSRSIILPNVHIGKGAVVASGAIVTKDVEPFSIVAGIPAKVIGKRDEKEFNYTPYFPLHIV